MRMYTSIFVAALVGVGAEPAQQNSSLTWQTDYGKAARDGERQGKPLAVFIGRGGQGWKGVSSDGSLSAESQDLLGSRYLPVYLDTNTDAGRRLATAFEMGDGPGLVLSDRSGENQTFRHQGM